MGVVIHHPSQNNTKTIKKPPSTTKMAGTSPLLKRPQQPTVQQPQSVREQIIHHHHHHHFNDEYISPTYKSTPLFKPEISPYDQVELPSQGRHAWGTHIHQYAGIGPLSFLGSQPKSRDLYVARSHRHYLSGFSYVRHDRINKSHITPFKKALNRANDDLVPPAALIPLEKYGRIQEDTQVIKEDKYASHQECCELFPQSSTKTELPVETTNEIKKLLDKRYGQTTYNEFFHDQRKNTGLSLGPQYQFYPSDDEDEKSEKCEEGEKSGKSEEGEKGEKCENGEKEENEENNENDGDSESTENQEKPENEPESKTKTNDKSSKNASQISLEEKLQTLTELEVEAETLKNSPDRAFWPAWPGNLSNQIQPVTLKIAEKRDVCCKQDINDVRMTTVFTHQQPPDYQLKSKKMFPKINQNSKPLASSEMAPAKVDFAYSGQATLYGSDAERALQNQDKAIREMPGCSRW